MKGLALFLVMFAGLAAAQGMTQLDPPVQIVVTSRLACAALGFVGGVVGGECRTVTSAPCSGRGCQPVTYTTNYLATWDMDGNPLNAQACSLVRHHLPGADQVTYLNGHTAADCHDIVFNPTGTSVVLDDIPFHYVATDATTGNELVNSNYAGFLYRP